MEPKEPEVPIYTDHLYPDDVLKNVINTLSEVNDRMKKLESRVNTLWKRPDHTGRMGNGMMARTHR